MPAFTYRAFGLAIQSDAPLLGLAPDTGDAPDLLVHMGRLPPHVELGPGQIQEVWRSEVPEDDPTDAVTLYSAQQGAWLLLVYADGMRFALSRTGTEIWAAWPAHSTPEQAGTYLLGPVLGLALRQRGVTCLHASVVVTGSHAIALTGPAGSGKSTTAAAYALHGGRVIADDIGVLHETGDSWTVQPTISGVRLWEDSVEMLFGRPDALPFLAQGWEKRLLDLRHSAGGFRADDAVPLGAVYVLGDPGPNDRIVASRVRGRDALMVLVSNTYANVLLDPVARRDEFTALTALAARVPIWRVGVPEGHDGLARFCAAVAAAGPSSDFQPADA
jgi:hypothetical protein